jgi:hypothetical protein
MKKAWSLACSVACFAVITPAVSMAQSLIPIVDIAPYGAGAPLAAGPPFAVTLPPYEIIASVRSAGFDPLSQPMQRGRVYVLLATDRHDADVRLTVDAHSGRVLSAMRVAGEFRDGAPYGDYEAAPRATSPGYPPPYERPLHYYERPAPPADVPMYYGPGYARGRAYAPPPIEEGDIRLAPRERSRLYDEPARRAPASASRPPLPRTRPGDIVSGAAREAAPAQFTPQTPSAPQGASPAAPEAAPAEAPAPRRPDMVPVAPLD